MTPYEHNKIPYSSDLFDSLPSAEPLDREKYQEVCQEIVKRIKGREQKAREHVRRNPPNLDLRVI